MRRLASFAASARTTPLADGPDAISASIAASTAITNSTIVSATITVSAKTITTAA